MFSTVESLVTKRANQRPVASSIMLINNICCPRPSNQSWSLVSHCTSSPKRLRRGRHSWIFSTCCFRARHSLAPIIHCRTVSRLASMSCFLARYSAASVGPNPRYTGCARILTASCSVSPLILRLEGSPRSPCATILSPRRFSSRSRRLTCLSVIPSSSAASFCVISFFFAFFRATRRSRSACVISSCPSATSPACMASIGHFYFAQIGHYHFAATKTAAHLSPQNENVLFCKVEMSYSRIASHVPFPSGCMVLHRGQPSRLSSGALNCGLDGTRPRC